MGVTNPLFRGVFFSAGDARTRERIPVRAPFPSSSSLLLLFLIDVPVAQRCPLPVPPSVPRVAIRDLRRRARMV